MADKDLPKATPTPRDYEEATFSELVPIRSSQINVLKSPLLWIIGVTGIVILALYSQLGAFFAGGGQVSVFITFGLIVIGWLLLSILAVVYLYSQTDRPVWHFVVPAIAIFLMLRTPLGLPYFMVFRGLLDEKWVGSSLIPHFIYMFSGAGLMEEAMKNTATLIGAVLMVRYAHLRASNSAIFDMLAIRGPLDGLLMGVVAGAMFIFIETGYQYFPSQFGDQPTAEGLLSGLMLLLPRTISGMVGHMGWAGILGYFIGLWVIRPATWKFMLYAWFVVSALHAAWNTSSFIPLLGPASTAATAVLLVACLLKARQINASLGAVRNDYGSIVIMPGDRPTAELLPMSVQAKPVVVEAVSPKLSIVIGDIRLKAVPSKPVDFSLLAATGLDISGLGAEVSMHPTRADVIGLKNTGSLTWRAILRDGKRIELETGRNLRLASGMQIDFGVGPIASIESSS